MPNTQTSVPAFVAAQVLTAQQQTEINTGIPVFATTVTRDAAFGGAGEKALAEGQFAYIEATNTTQYYDGAAWQPVGAASGLTLISATTVGTTVSSVTVSSAFSATYDNYKVTYTGGVTSAAAPDIAMILGATTAGYYLSLVYVPYASTTPAGANINNGASWSFAGVASTTMVLLDCDIYNPFKTDETQIALKYASLINGGAGAGFLNNTTSYTAFTITPQSGTLTGGTIRVYGYQNS